MAKRTKAAETASQSPVTNLPDYFIGLEVGGDALIQNNFSQKSVEEMLKKQMGFEVKREPKKPRDCIERAHIRNMAEVVCIPPIAFKKGMLTAAAAAGKSFKKTHLRQQLFIEGNSIPFTFERMLPRMDIVRLGGVARTPDVRFRPMFENWRARLIITYSDALKVESVIDLLNRAGKVGVGEWRPEKDGTFGTYHVFRNITDEKEIEEVRKICAPQLKPLVIPEWAMDAELDSALLAKIAASEQNHAKNLADGEDVTDQEEVLTGDEVYDQEVA